VLVYPEPVLSSPQRGAPTPQRPARPAGCTLAGLGLLAGLLSPSSEAHAVRLEVRSRATLNVQVERRDDGVHLVGHAVDDAGEPLGSEPVEVQVRGLDRKTVVTDPAGGFDVLVRAADAQNLRRLHGAQLAWRADIPATRTHGAAEASGLLDLTRSPTTLRLALSPSRVALHTAGVRVVASLTAAGRALPRAPVRLRVGSGPALTGATGDDGRATFRLLPSALDRAGSVSIKATYEGTGRYASATAQARLDVVRPTRLTLRVSREGSASRGRYRFSGRLADARGPLGGAPVVILAEPLSPAEAPDARSRGSQLRRDAAAPPEGAARPTNERPRVVALAVTDPDGLFLATTPAQAFRAEIGARAEIRAVYRPTTSHYAGAESAPVSVAVPPAGGVPASWYAFALAWVLGVVGAVRAARPIRAWLRARRLHAAREVGAAHEADAEDPPLLAPSRAPSPRARRDHIAGHLVDAHSGRPLPAGAVQVRRASSAPGESHRGQTSAQGRDDAPPLSPTGAFEFGPLAPGPYELVATCPGYAPREVTVSCPHGGELDGVRVQLVASKRRVRDIFFAACRALQVDALWGRDTPAEACEAVAGRRPLDVPPGLQSLRELTEAAWFAGQPLADRDVARAEELFRSLGGAPQGAREQR